MRCALEQVIDIVTEARGDSRVLLPASIHDGIKDFKVAEQMQVYSTACKERGGGCQVI